MDFFSRVTCECEGMMIGHQIQMASAWSILWRAYKTIRELSPPPLHTSLSRQIGTGRLAYQPATDARPAVAPPLGSAQCLLFLRPEDLGLASPCLEEEEEPPPCLECLEEEAPGLGFLGGGRAPSSLSEPGSE